MVLEHVREIYKINQNKNITPFEIFEMRLKCRSNSKNKYYFEN